MFLIGTRGSKLALRQVDIVIGLLNKKFPELIFEKKIIKTTGDKILDAPLAKIGDKGLFVKEIDEAVSEGDVDFAVHSMKDVPVELPSNLKLACVPEREDAGDALISRDGLSINELPRSAVIGTSSIRRKAELLNYRSDFIMKELRGNVDTRLRKLGAGEYDAIVMAGAGLKRLGFEKNITQELPLNTFLPSVGQGAIAIVARKDFKHEFLTAINDAQSMRRCVAERALLHRLGGGCQVPVGVLTAVGKKLKIKAAVLSPDGKKRIQVEMEGKAVKAENLGNIAAEKLLENGADVILEEVKG
ncbi:MAG: hydroxymethylbilane synthase [Candidatus Hydrothermarchaeota archaeon]|nr:hydroxymethylbilane synthase [Candidatus Hydrothermarchaeota archaeon]